MREDSNPGQHPRHLWPWLVLAGAVLAVVLAFLWMRAEVRRVRSMERFDYRAPKAEPASPPAQPGTTNQ
jgi:hypothetical protein